LLLGAALILVVGPALTSRRRHALGVVAGVAALLSLFWVGSGYPADVNLVRRLVDWLGEPALALRVPAFEPFVWVLILSLLAIVLAQRDDELDRLTPLNQATYFALTATACGVILAGNYRTLAFALLLFDGTAALFALVTHRPNRAVGRLLLGVLSSVAVIGLAQGGDYLTAQPRALGSLFSLVVWLRLGLYPLVESQGRPGGLRSMRLGWTVVNLTVGLYLVSGVAAPWLVVLAGTTTALHGALAWLEPNAERALAYTAYGLAGGILTMAAAVGDELGVVAASISTLAALVALALTPARLGRPSGSHPRHIWGYLPPTLATASLVGIPFTLGWEGRGALYQATWQAGALGVLALVVVAEGAALSMLYRYWQRLFAGAPGERQDRLPGNSTALADDEGPAKSTAEKGGRGQNETNIWPLMGATLACIPFLIPVLGPYLVLGPIPTAVLGPTVFSALLGLVGSLLWALFLGYGRRRLLASSPVSLPGLINVLRLGWLLRGLGHALDSLGRVLLRLRAVIEGEHYLAWAILLALIMVLVILLR
jgi:hypothetical protein